MNGTTTGAPNAVGFNQITLPATAVGDRIDVQQTYIPGPGSVPANSATSLTNAQGTQVAYHDGTANYSYTTAPNDSPLTFARAAGNGFQTVSTATTAVCSPAPVAPTITSVSPASGETSGGTSITLAGSDFTGATAVTFGGAAATTFAVVNATTITAITPAHAAGTVDIVVTTPAGSGTGSRLYTYIASTATTTTALVSSRNPSEAGQAVTFTATVTSSTGATGTGTVTFLANGVPLGSAVLAGGGASLTTASLSRGSTTITATYDGSAGFAGSTSPALVQVVNVPSDSLKLRSMQVLAAPVVAQASGQAISGAVDSAIAEGFSDGGALMTPSGSGVRFNFSADTDKSASTQGAVARDPFVGFDRAKTGAGSLSVGQPSSRVDDAFSALAYAGPIKAAPQLRSVELREWLGWAEVRGATLDRSNVSIGNTPTLHGSQVNLLAGLTRKLTPAFLVGVLGGYETFDYRSDALQGRLKGEGWTVGAYLGWRITNTLRYDASVAYSGIGYDGTAGTAAGSFSGTRWLFATGLTGSYQSGGVLIEPSARVYALWENENAYVDTLGTLQDQRRFTTGRASGGLKVAYPIAWTSSVVVAPYAGLYGDYYFNADTAGAVATGAVTPAATVLDGWSARFTGGLAIRLPDDATIAVGGEFGGIGNATHIATYRARASVPFSAR